MNIENLLSWGPEKEINTIRGKRLVRTAPATGQFWGEWKRNQNALRSQGISPKKEGNNWVVSWYREPSSLVGQAATPTLGPSDTLADVPTLAAQATANPDEVKSFNVLPERVKPERIWSEEQKAIFSWFASDGKGLVVRARAGTGKTTTIKHAISFATEEISILYAIFAKKNQLEAQASIFDPRVDIKTLHSVGFRLIRDVWPQSKADDMVERDRVDFVAGQDTQSEVKGQIVKLVGFAKNILLSPTLENLIDLADSRGIECPAYENPENGGWNVAKLATKALEVLELSKIKDAQNRISFDDMVWLPVVMGWTRELYDLVIVDEAQDMNLPQLTMAKAIKKNRICVVGDDRQAIFGFRGAASNGIDNMKVELGAEEKGLTVTYRCPKCVVELAAKIVPDYQFAPSAPEGKIESVTSAGLLGQAKCGDAILSRANAPLVPTCLQLLRKGIAAKIEGRDIGKGLIALVEKLNVRTIPQLLTRLENHRAQQMKRFSKTSKNQDAKIQALNDTVDTLIAISEGASGVSEVIQRLNSLFSDGGDPKLTVTLSTVHKAKGLEWSKVFILSDTFRRKNTDKPITGEQAREEQNIYYVALTRAKETLVFVESFNAGRG